MLDEKEFEAVKQILLRINETISELDSSIRIEAFEILAARYLGDRTAKSPKANDAGAPAASVEVQDTSDLGTFLSSFDTGKPADAVMVLVAWLYSHYGVYRSPPRKLKSLLTLAG